ncbi:MAG: L-lysine 6-transaminase [Bacteroidetes bacterium]|nr:L-lysine 6-transaminase [Bacteroidota bacterium]
MKNYEFLSKLVSINKRPSSRITPQNVHSVLKKSIQAEGYNLVLDLEKSKGSIIVDSKTGKEYLDFFTFFASNSLGMNHPKLDNPDFIQKIGKVALTKTANPDIYTEVMAEFVDTVRRLIQPNFMPHAFYIDGGTLAVENALKAAFDWKVRKNFKKGYTTERGHQVIHFKQAFHGRSGYTLSLTNTDPNKTDYFPKFNWPRINNPAIYFPLNDRSLYDVIEKEKIAIKQIKNAIVNNPDDIAAILIEPIQGEGGDNHFRKEFFKELRTIADENAIMLILDEVQTGIGLTGKMWAHEYFVKPDMITFGKKTQICGFFASNRIDEIPENVFAKKSRINSTFGGNIVDMVRFTKIIQIIKEEKLVKNAAKVGEYLLKELVQLQIEFPKSISNSRGRGLFCAFDLTSIDETEKLKKKLYENGVIVLSCGEKSLRFRPNLAVSKSEINQAIEIIRRSIKEL